MRESALRARLAEIGERVGEIVALAGQLVSLDSQNVPPGGGEGRCQESVLEFLRAGEYAFSVHRTWPGRARLYSNASVYRRAVTNGCVNVQPEVYDRLLACCAGQVIRIEP